MIVFVWVYASGILNSKTDPTYLFGCSSIIRAFFKIDIDCKIDTLYTEKVEVIAKAVIHAFDTIKFFSSSLVVHLVIHDNKNINDNDLSHFINICTIFKSGVDVRCGGNCSTLSEIYFECSLMLKFDSSEYILYFPQKHMKYNADDFLAGDGT